MSVRRGGKLPGFWKFQQKRLFSWFRVGKKFHQFSPLLEKYWHNPIVTPPGKIISTSKNSNQLFSKKGFWNAENAQVLNLDNESKVRFSFHRTAFTRSVRAQFLVPYARNDGRTWLLFSDFSPTLFHKRKFLVINNAILIFNTYESLAVLV